MKLTKTEAVAFMVALGFPKAPTWEDDVLASRLKATPERIKPNDVPEEMQGLYAELKGMDKDDKVILEGDKEEKKPAPAPSKKPAPAQTKKSSKEEKEEKPAKKPAPAPAPTKKPASKRRGPPAPLDKFGCREGTICSKVNAVVGAGWKTDKEIAEAAGLKLTEARGRLYAATVQGIFESKRIIQYRLKPKA